MNKIKLLAGIFLVFSSSTLTSCDNEPIDSAINLNDFGGGSGAVGTFTAKIGSDTFNALQIEAELSGSAFGPEMNINGIMPNGKVMNIQLINPAIGTFAANTSLQNLLLFEYSENFAGTNSFTSFNSASGTSTGTLTITQFDTTTKKISGTFSFTGYDSTGSTNQRQITNGNINNLTFTVAP